MLHCSYTKLKVWQKSIELTDAVYDLTNAFPKEERYGLISQMRRSAVSIASNIAEGSQRTSNKEFANFILISRGSLAELETQIYISLRRHFGSEQMAQEILKKSAEISRMLHSFHTTLRAHRS